VQALPLPAPPPARGRPLLVLTGFMGTGKTTAGRLAADALGLPFFDNDPLVEARGGAPIPEIFQSRGEAAFRELERGIVVDAARLSAAVVATGGGAPLHRESFTRLAEGNEVVVLAADEAELARRLPSPDGRPLLHPDPATRIPELMAERAPAYAAAGPAVDTTGLSPEQTAKELVERYRNRVPPEEPAHIEVRGGSRPYPVVVGNGAVSDLDRLVRDAVPDAMRMALVVDREAPMEHVLGPPQPPAQRGPGGPGLDGFEVFIVDIPAGEEAKTVDMANKLWRGFRGFGLEPTDVVVAVGGGTTLDVAGFAAATYARGVALVNVPTTLLAMVDASLGGKVGIDHAGAKNLVGAFHDPRLVVVDPELLASLPAATLRAGMSEVIKAAMLASPLFFEWLETAPMTDGVPDNLEWVIEQAVRIKAGYVGVDPRDEGPRKSLNLGHTFAHAVEAASGYAVSHGEAVAVGLVAAARLGTRTGHTDPDVETRLTKLLDRLGLPVAAPMDLEVAALLDAMTADKKRRGGRAAFVVPAADGAVLLEGIDPGQAVTSLIPPP
jgi:shikimate kinase/3-dehydroquinate synthase